MMFFHVAAGFIDIFVQSEKVLTQADSPEEVIDFSNAPLPGKNELSRIRRKEMAHWKR